MRRILVVTAVPARRRLWEERLRDAATVVRHCAGPTASCPLPRQGTCPLHLEADSIVYDGDAVTPEFLVALLASPPRAPIHFVAADPTGPRTTHVLTDGVVHPASVTTPADAS